ncbi:MAG: cytochrome c biogenesis protein CcdA [Aestuariivita sp.]|nr:cytochrome c biogenesis protein CcdA [Aestuariivita sp.]
MFGIDIFDAALVPALFVALSAGVISFFSPCVLPIVPPYLAYMSGVSISEIEEDHLTRRKAIYAALFFVLGLSTIFLLLGFTVSILGQFFLVNQQWFVGTAGVAIMFFGVHFIGIYRIGFLDREFRIDVGDRGGSAFGAYLLGLAFAFGWTPCIGPILGAILSLAATEANSIRGTALLASYAIGFGLPFLMVATFFSRSKRLLLVVRQYSDQLEKTMGLLLWTVGLFMLTGQFSDFSWWLLETFPGLANLG